jgi:hypothetical protein
MKADLQKWLNGGSDISVDENGDFIVKTRLPGWVWLAFLSILIVDLYFIFKLMRNG